MQRKREREARDFAMEFVLSKLRPCSLLLLDFSLLSPPTGHRSDYGDSLGEGDQRPCLFVRVDRFCTVDDRLPPSRITERSTARTTVTIRPRDSSCKNRNGSSPPSIDSMLGKLVGKMFFSAI